MSAKLLLRSTVVLCLSTAAAQSQQLTNVNAVFDGEKVTFSFDLLASHEEDRFSVTLYSSHNSYQTPLSLLVGDAGEGIAPGKNHMVTWDAKRSLPPDFNGELTFKIKATVVVGLHHPMRLEVMPLDYAAYKRGRILNVEWRGGIAAEPIGIELIREEKVVAKISEVENNNVFSWKIPKKEKATSGYRIRISKATRPEVTAVSQQFEIKPKISLLVKLIPLAVIGGAAALIASTPDEETPDLPGPLSPGQ